MGHSPSVRRCILGGVPVITAVCGDITAQDVDAIVNAANTAMRGVVAWMVRSIAAVVPRSCATASRSSRMGWPPVTRAGRRPAIFLPVGYPTHGWPQLCRWAADRSLLDLLPRPAVADELGARTVAFPLISAGIFGWPQHDAITAAVATIAAADTRVDEVRLVAFDPGYTSRYVCSWRCGRRSASCRAFSSASARLPSAAHSAGHECFGMYWRVAITSPDNIADDVHFPISSTTAPPLWYSTGGLTEFAGGGDRINHP